MSPRTKGYLLLAPAVVLTSVFFLGGLLDGLLKSFGYFPALNQTTFSLDAYTSLVESSRFNVSLWVTFRAATVSTILSILLGVSFALAIYFSKSHVSQRFVRFFQLPLTIPHLAAGYFMILLFSQSGFLSRLLFQLGWLEGYDSFPILTNDRLGFGIILTYVWKEAPFVALLVYPVLARVGASWQETARVYGASGWQFTRSVLLPAMRPAIVMAGLIVFVFTFTTFEVPYLLGVTYPATLPVYAYQLYTSGDFASRPEALAIMWVLTAVSLLAGTIAYRYYRKSYVRGWE